MKNSEVDVDYVSSCTEEVALEGLDGITVSGLWVRLENRPNFPLAMDEPCKNWLWKLIVSRGSIEFFVLPQPRGALVVYNRFEFVDADTGFIIEPETTQDDIYPICIVKGANVQGSCSTFETRVNVTAEIRDESLKPKLTLSEVEEKWGETLVLVCSQEERLKALTGLRVDPLISMPDLLYCVLERIGRARSMGEVTSGKLSMSCVCDPKTLFYMRKKLWKKNLITQQVFHHRVGTTRFKKCVLLHVTRFSNRRKSTLSVMLGQVYNVLNSKPDRRETTKVLFSQLGLKDDSVKKFVKSHLACLAEVAMRPVREVFPNLPEEDCVYGNGNERYVKMISLLDHVTDSNLDEKVSASENRHFDDEDDSQEESAFAVSSTGTVDTTGQYIDKPLFRQGFELIEKCGSKGLTIREFAARVGLRALDCRMLVNGLVASKMVIKVPVDIGKQRAFRLVAQQYCNKAHEDLVYECRRFLRIANIDVDSESSVVTSKNGLLGDVVNVCLQTRPSTRGSLNLRTMKRACRILEMIKSAKVIESTTSFRATIVEDEANEGIGSIDKKTVLRLVYVMINDGLVKSFKTTLKFGNTEKKIMMFCDPSVSIKDEVFQNALQIAKFRRFAVCTTEAKAQVKKRTELKNEGIKLKMEYMPRIGYSYGYEPKLLRMKTIHKFFCYLACDYDGDCAKVSDEDREAIEVQMADGFAVPTIYHGKLSWKTFVPPLPEHKDWPHRWILLSDVLLRLPLSIFVKIINVTFNIGGLMGYLDHPVKRHFLVSQIPTDIRNMLLFARKYIYNAHELATKLGYMGLVSFSPNQQKEKDQVFLYLHRNVTLKDTKTSKPSYMTVSTDEPYESLSFTLDTLEDADVFWQALEDICVKTPLGLWNAALGQSVTVELPQRKQCLIECSRPKTVHQVVDDGHVPGDGLGAGGLDSSLFSHLKRNWRWINVNMSKEKMDVEKKPAKAKWDAGEEAGPNSQKRLARLSTTDKRRTLTVQRQEKTSETGIEAVAVHGEVSASVAARKRKASTEPKHVRKAKKPKVRTVKARKVRRARRPFHDETDKAALERMRNLRVTWTDQEDSFLLLCKVASILLDPASRTMFVLSSVVRDLLYLNCPQLSMNKTSHACQRRIRYMMLNSDTVYNVSVFVGEAKQDQEIIELCSAPRPSRNNDEACRVAFTLVLNKLLDKFKLQASGLSTTIKLPSTLDELEAKYSLVLSENFILTDSRHHDVKNVVDIRCSVAYTLLIGALGVDKDKSNWSYHLYRILQQYPDNLLRSVFAALRADSLVCAKKKMTRAITGFSLASIPYQLSLKFHRIFATLVNEGIYAEASSLLGQLLEDASAGCSDSLGVPIHNDSDGGFATVFQACLATRRITSNIYVADQVLVFDEESFRKSHQEWSAGYQDWQAVPQDEKRDDDVSAAPCDGTLRMAPSSNASRFALYMLRQQMTSSHGTKHNMSEYLSLELCPVHCRVKKPSASFIVPKGLVERFETRISVVIPLEIPPFEAFLQFMGDLREVAPTRRLYDEILRHKELGIKEQDLEVNSCSEEYAALHRRLDHLIEGHQVIRVGVTVPRYVAMVHGRPWILETVRISKEEKAEALNKLPSIAEAAICTPLDEKTAEDSAEPLPSRPRRNSIRGKSQDDRKNVGQTDRKVVRLVYRPWRKPDGSVNRPLLNQMLRGVAGQVMFNPGISLEDLCAKFLPALQQVQVIELVDMLVEVGCFHRCFLKAPAVASAFSRPNTISITERKGGACDVTYLEADVECIPKLAQLLHLHSRSKTSCESQSDPGTSAQA